MKLLHFLLLLLFPLLSSSDAAGDWLPINNPGDPHVIDIAKYVVELHNKQTGASLQFVNVVKGKSQVFDADSMNYRLVIETKEVIKGIRYYRANIYENKSQNVRRLDSFVLTDPDWDI